MEFLIDLLIRHDLLIVFAVTLLARAGAPLPASPLLVVAGGLASEGSTSLPALLGVSIVANVLADGAWYVAGRRHGARVLGLLCRVSLSPDTCVRQSELLITRWGASALLAAKFLPGVSVVAAPMAGAAGMSVARFVVYDAIAGALWTAVFLGLGLIFSDQIQQLLDAMGRAGALALPLIAAVLLGFVGWRWQRRRRVREAATLPRIPADELQALIDLGAAPVVIDVRSRAAAELDPRHLPGAMRLDLADIARHAARLPRDREVVLYCSCPNEVSAAIGARALREAGVSQARPLAGGLEGWAGEGRALSHAAWQDPPEPIAAAEAARA